MSSITVGIAGITGKFAGLLTEALLKRSSNVQIRGFARNPAKLDISLSSVPNLQLFQGDAFDKDRIRPFVKGCDVVVCCYLGDDNLMIEGQKLLIDIAEEERVPRFVASDWSLDWTKLKMGEVPSKEPCQKVKAYLDGKSRIQGVHILVGGFTEVVFAPFFSIWDQKTSSLKFWGGGDEVWEVTTYFNAAEYTAAVCLDREATGVLRFAGDVISINDIAKTFDEVYSFTPKLERLGSLDELHTKMFEERQKYGADFYKYVFHFYHYFTLSGKALMGPHYDNKRYPDIRPFTVKDFMKTTDAEHLGATYFPWMHRT